MPVAPPSLMLEANGLRFACDAAGSGPDVALLLHGFPENRYSWRAQLPVLAAQGWRAVAPDLRGYGASSRPAGKAAYHLDHLIEDVAGMFDALGARKRLLIAHDWGAIIAWHFALQRRLDLDGLVIMNVPHPAVAAAAMRRPCRQWLRSWYILFFQLPWAAEFGLGLGRAWMIGEIFRGMAVDKSRFPDAVLNHYREPATQPGALTAMVNYYRANRRRMVEIRDPRPIETPTLMIWGEQDSALGIELTRGYDPYVRDFTLHTLPGASHWVQQDAPEAVNAHLLAWLQARAIRPQPNPQPTPQPEAS